MKTEKFTCDICQFTTDKESEMFDAALSIGSSRQFRHNFHVCSTCWSETPKGVFQKAFNQLCRLFSTKKRRPMSEIAEDIKKNSRRK